MLVIWGVGALAATALAAAAGFVVWRHATGGQVRQLLGTCRELVVGCVCLHLSSHTVPRHPTPPIAPPPSLPSPTHPTGGPPAHPPAHPPTHPPTPLQAYEETCTDDQQADQSEDPKPGSGAATAAPGGGGAKAAAAPAAGLTKGVSRKRALLSDRRIGQRGSGVGVRLGLGVGRIKHGLGLGGLGACCSVNVRGSWACR